MDKKKKSDKVGEIINNIQAITRIEGEGAESIDTCMVAETRRGSAKREIPWAPSGCSLSATKKDIVEG